jgi:hypothetical protein
LLIFQKEGFEEVFDGRDVIFIAGDVLWYPVQGRPNVREGPGVFIAFGRPPETDRSSYLQWEKGGIAPQVVFEILSAGNTLREMARKQDFYNRYGVEEYYIFDPEDAELDVYIRNETGLELVEESQRFQSPRTDVTFWTSKEHGLSVVMPNGGKMISPKEQRERASREEHRAEQESQRAEEQQQRAERLAEKLREMGVDPTAL